MKKLLFILVVMFSFNNAIVYAKRNDSHQEITLTQPERKEPINKENGPITRSITQPAYAYLYHNIICIEFYEILPTATINIINESTNEVVYTETYSAPTSININLSGENNGNYILRIESDDTFICGNFIL